MAQSHTDSTLDYMTRLTTASCTTGSLKEGLGSAASPVGWHLRVIFMMASFTFMDLLNTVQQFFPQNSCVCPTIPMSSLEPFSVCQPSMFMAGERHWPGESILLAEMRNLLAKEKKWCTYTNVFILYGVSMQCHAFIVTYVPLCHSHLYDIEGTNTEGRKKQPAGETRLHNNVPLFSVSAQTALQMS